MYIFVSKVYIMIEFTQLNQNPNILVRGVPLFLVSLFVPQLLLVYFYRYNLEPVFIIRSSCQIIYEYLYYHTHVY